jgi:predicted urease superfamily metal-dependent hydrolase
MAIRTFNIDDEVYKQFSEYCKKQGISMSKRVENFIKEEVLKIKDKGGLKKNIVEKKDISVEKHTFSRYC